MTITTKFNVADMVWFVNKNMKAQCAPVTKVEAKIEAGSSTQPDAEKFKVTECLYLNVGTDTRYDCFIVDSDKAYRTREELIENL